MSKIHPESQQINTNKPTDTKQNQNVPLSQNVVQKLEHPTVFSGFRFIGKAVIILPIILIIAAVLLRLYNLYIAAPDDVYQNTIKTPKEKPTQEPQSKEEQLIDQLMGKKTDQTKSKQSTDLSFDLKTPRICSFSDKEKEITAYIKNEQVYATIEATESASLSYILVSDDCFYQWEEKKKEGKKMCGLSSLKSLLGTFSMFGGGGMDINTIMSFLPQLGINLDLDTEGGDISMEYLEKQCVEKKVDDKLFTIPEDVSFTEESLSGFGL